MRQFGFLFDDIRTREWTQALYSEYENICFQYRLKLSDPIIEINDSRSTWGSWDEERGIIRISRSLIERHSWDIVVSILKHEIAHKIVHERFSGMDRGHGHAFEKACDLVGLSGEYRSASVDLSDSLPGHWKAKSSGETAEEKLLSRVEKLLALAGSDNENEALAAMNKVQQLYEKYNIDRIKSREKSQYVYSIINHEKKRIEPHQQMICSILASHFFVKVIFSHMYSAEKRESHKTIELFGTRENVLMAEYVYHFLHNKLKQLWSANREMVNMGRKKSTWRSYYMGVLEGFQEKLEKMKLQGSIPESDRQLISIDDPLLKGFMHERYPRTCMRSTGGSSYDRNSYSEGKKAGRNLTISKGIRKSDGNRGRLLT